MCDFLFVKKTKSRTLGLAQHDNEGAFIFRVQFLSSLSLTLAVIKMIFMK